MTETSVTVASGQTSRKVVGIATSAISSGTSAMNDAKTKARTSRAPTPASSGLDGTLGAAALGAVGRRGAQRVQAGDLDGRAADGDAGERRLRRARLGLTGLDPPFAGIETSAKVVRPSSETKSRSCVEA